MSHGLYTKRDFQVAKEVAWHKLTTIATPTREHFPEIERRDLEMVVGHDDNGNAKYAPVIIGGSPRSVAVSLDDNEACGDCFNPDTYAMFTPREAYDYVCEVLAGTGFEIISLGMLWSRSQWFISTHLAELEQVNLGDGRESKFMFNFSGGLDRSLSPQAELSNIVAVCSNTVSLSRMTGEILFKRKATKNFKVALEEKKQVIEKAVGMAAIFKAQMEKLAEKKCDTSRAEKVLAGFLAPVGADKLSTRTKNTVQEIAGLFSNGIGNKGETEFDLLNGVTEFYTRHAFDDKGKAFASSEFGGAADTKAEFARLMTENMQAGRPNLQKTVKRGEELLSASAN